MPSPRQVITAYDQKRQPSSTGSGTRPPPAEHTRLEQWDNDGNPYLAEYVGSGKLKDKSALISGGATGIGRSVATMFAREGADVAIIYLPNQQSEAEVVKRSVEDAGKRCCLIPGDLRAAGFCEDAVALHIKTFGGMNVLVNNAAQQGHSEDISELDLDYAEATFQTNVFAAFKLIKHAVPHLKRGSSIISSVSIGAYCGELMADKVDYAATKGAIVSFTRALSAQLAPKGIRCNMVAPGPIWTPLHAATRNVPTEVLDNLAFDIPLWGRMGQPAELGPSYVFLASADSNYMSGQTIHVSAGMWTGS